MELQRAKGTRDFGPGEKILRDKIIKILKDVFEKYGFNPIETPILERLDVLGSKYAGGDEILKETFKLKDQGGRDLGLRYDLTVSLSRFIAMNKGLRMPFKTYQIERVFRDGPMKTGRYREFWQCDVDVVGCKKIISEIELLSIAKDVFSKIGIDVVIKINNRKILDAIIEKCGVAEEKTMKVILVLDKIDKVGIEAVKKELIDDVKIEKDVADLLIEKVLIKGNNFKKIETLKKLLGDNKSFDEIREIIEGVDCVEFEPYLARGLAYYTGTVFEVFMKDKTVKSSLAAGGRYDKMIGDFIGDGKEYPAVGISFGLELITDVLKMKNKKERKTVVDVYVVSIGCFKEAYEIVKKMRFGGLNVDMDLLGRNISNNLEYANKAGIKYVVFVGKKELELKKVKLRDMETGDEKLLTLNECFKLLEK